MEKMVKQVKQKKFKQKNLLNGEKNWLNGKIG